MEEPTGTFFRLSVTQLGNTYACPVCGLRFPKKGFCRGFKDQTHRPRKVEKR